MKLAIGASRAVSAIVLLAAGGLACEGLAPPKEWLAPDSLAVLRPMPNVRGSAVCKVNPFSVDLPEGVTTQCELGDGVHVTARGETIFAFERMRLLAVSDSVTPLLDLWNAELKSAWIAEMGSAPDHLKGESLSETPSLQAQWQDSAGIRHIVYLSRARDSQVLMRYTMIDCRPTNARVPAVPCW